MKLILFILFFLISTPVFAKQYLVEKPDGTIAILNYIDGAKDTLQDVLRDMGFSGYTVFPLKPSDFPAENINSKYWRVNYGTGPRIRIDHTAIQADLDAEQQIQDDADDVLKKMCPSCTRDDFKKILKAEKLKE